MRKKIFAILLVATFIFPIGLGILPSSVGAQGSQPQNSTNRCQAFLSKFNIGNNPNDNPFSWVGVNEATLNRYCTVQGFIFWLLQLAIGFAGVIAILFIVIGGYQYMTSSGNEEQAEKGRKTLMNALIGLVVIVMSFVIIRIVMNTLTGNTGTNTPPAVSDDINKTADKQPIDYPAGFNSISGQGCDAVDTYRSCSITLTIPKDLNSCGDISSVYLQVSRAGGGTVNIRPTNSYQEGNNTIASFDIGTPSSYGYTPDYLSGRTSLADKSMGLQAVVCGTPSGYSKSVSVMYTPLEVTPRGEEKTTALAEAINNSKFSVMVDSQAKNFTVYARALSKDIQEMCTDPTEAGIRLTISSATEGAQLVRTMPTDVLLSVRAGMSAPLESEIPTSQYNPNTVEVFICGNKISRE